MRILIIEDYEPLRLATSKALREAGHTVDAAADGASGLEQGLTGRYDVIVLDLMLPGMDGIAVLRALREAGVESDVLVLTARDTVEDRIAGLDSGADDYLVKPFAMGELLARTRALVRRRYAQKDPVIVVGSVSVDTVARRAYLDGEVVDLTAREYALLEYLALRAGQIVSRAEIWRHFYEGRSAPSSNVIDVYVSYLRNKLETPGGPKILHTRRGQGYLLALEE
jgi:two-component system copper resistance phosphate regulon response regulator CusR